MGNMDFVVDFLVRMTSNCLGFMLQDKVLAGQPHALRLI